MNLMSCMAADSLCDRFANPYTGWLSRLSIRLAPAACDPPAARVKMRLARPVPNDRD
jgi:hypothetical protein